MPVTTPETETLCAQCKDLGIKQNAHHQAYRHPTKGPQPALCFWHKAGNKHPREIEMEKEKKAEELRKPKEAVSVPPAAQTPKVAPPVAPEVKLCKIDPKHGPALNNRMPYCSACWGDVIRKGKRKKGEFTPVPRRKKKILPPAPVQIPPVLVIDEQFLEVLWSNVPDTSFKDVAGIFWERSSLELKAQVLREFLALKTDA